VEARLDAIWDACLALAWASYRAGTVPVGSVVVDAGGAIVAEGRNRIFEPPGVRLSGSRLAHAEVDALSQLPSTRRHPDHALYSALEPCLLCIGAALQATVGSVSYLAADPYGGACRLPFGHPNWVDRQLAIDGPFGGPLARVAAMLQSAFWLGSDSEAAARLVDAFGADARAAAERLRAVAELPAEWPNAKRRLLDLL
jgi:tRNA(adenine34) deaminase